MGIVFHGAVLHGDRPSWGCILWVKPIYTWVRWGKSKDIGEVIVGQVKSGQVILGRVMSNQVRSSQVKTVQVMSNHARIVLVNVC
jgi:hypothetical protein